MSLDTPAKPPLRRRWRLKDLRRTIRYYLMLPFIALLSRLPLEFARRLGRGAGTLGWIFARSERLRAMENLRAALGAEKSEAELRRICRGVFRNTAVSVFELLVIRRWPKEKVRRVFPLDEDFRRIAADSPQGIVGITAHLGSWELLGLLYGVYLPGRMTAVAKRIYFKKFQDLVERFRRGAGMEVIYTDESPRRMLKAIRDGMILGLLADQDLKVLNGIFVDFFGRPAYTTTTPVNLARATGRPVMVNCLVRHGKGFRILYELVPLVETGKKEEDLLENTRRWTRILEGYIRAYPDQWAWFHRRWRTRPEDGPRIERRMHKKKTSMPGAAGA